MRSLIKLSLACVAQPQFFSTSNLLISFMIISRIMFGLKKKKANKTLKTTVKTHHACSVTLNESQINVNNPPDAPDAGFPVFLNT